VSLHPAHPNWLFYYLGGPFFMSGAGDPEDFLYRGSENADGTRDGDQDALIDKIVPTGANSIYLMAVRSHGGDGDATHNPFVDHDPAAGLNDLVLEQWEDWFSRMDEAGVVIFFFFYDDGSRIWNTGDSVGGDEQAFIQALVDRFEHHRHLIWVVAEEYQERYSPERVSAIAAAIKAADDHDHPVAVHKLSGLDFSEFADDPGLDQFAIQYNVPDAEDLHGGLLLAWDDAASRYNLNMSEAADWGTGTEARNKAWAAAMAGAYVMVFQMDIASTSVADLEDLGRLRGFFESTDFYTMEPRDDLANADTEYVLAREAKSYILYARQGGAGLGLQDLFAGSYRRVWLDIASGLEVIEDSVELEAGAQVWTRPAGIGAEAAVYALRLDGPNDVPETVDQGLTTVGSSPLPVQLGFLDPDGPGPHVYTVTDLPAHGALAGSAPGLTYTAKDGFTGTDSFEWVVSDGLDTSPPATVSIQVTVDGPPTASDFKLFGRTETPAELPFSEHAADPEGEPLTFSIATEPASGDVTQVGGVWTYTPDPGFVGTDSLSWLASDGVLSSEPATTTLYVAGEAFVDHFDRPDSEVVGNGWVEEEIVGQATLAQQSLTFDSIDESDRPLVRRSFATQGSGGLLWTFDLDFERTGLEGTYAFHLQLGDGAQMSDSQPNDLGVAVNLVWGGPNNGLSDHEALGYILDGSTTQLAIASGRHSLALRVDLDGGVFDLELDGQTLAEGVPFENPVALDTIRFFADGLNAQNFQNRSIDDLEVLGSDCAAADGFDLTLADAVVDTTELFEVCNQIVAGPNWQVQSPGDVTLRASSVVFRNGVTVGAQARLTVELAVE
jgi:hypothetical protein